MNIPMVTICSIDFFVCNAPMRMPFRFGSTTLTASAVLHVRMEVEIGNGGRVEGWSADMIAPKWFEKSDEKSYAQCLDELLAVAQNAASIYRELGSRPISIFDLWKQGYRAGKAWSTANEINDLMGSNGPSLMERALIDAVGIYAGLTYHEMLTHNVLGIDLGSIHNELDSMAVQEVIGESPLESLHIRHTVGLVDPLRDEDIQEEAQIDDGLPQSLESYILEQGIRYFKVKIGGDPRTDFERLQDIYSLLDLYCRDYFVTIDGNEQYNDVDSLIGLIERAKNDLPNFFSRIIYIEQPLDRALALNTEASVDIRRAANMLPLLIDESDGDLDTFKTAIDLGYRGVSSKACKGLIKALGNVALAKYKSEPGISLFVSAEDLTNIPVVSLHQDLAHVAALGLPHLERNGHHYIRGLDHLSEKERKICRLKHPELYTENQDLLSLNIVDGAIDVRSLQLPGLGVDGAVDVSSMTPLNEWDLRVLLDMGV